MIEKTEQLNPASRWLASIDAGGTPGLRISRCLQGSGRPATRELDWCRELDGRGAFWNARISSAGTNPLGNGYGGCVAYLELRA